MFGLCCVRKQNIPPTTRRVDKQIINKGQIFSLDDKTKKSNDQKENGLQHYFRMFPVSSRPNGFYSIEILRVCSGRRWFSFGNKYFDGISQLELYGEMFGVNNSKNDRCLKVKEKTVHAYTCKNFLSNSITRSTTFTFIA